MAFNKEVGKANVKITGDSKGLKKELKNAQSGIVKFKSSAISAFKGAAVGVGVITAAVGVMMVKTKQALETLDKIGKSAKNVGLTAEAFQELAHAADLSGVGVDLFQKSIARLEKASEDAKDGLATMQRAFHKMGISVEDLRGASPEKLLALVSDGMSGIKDPTQQAAIAMQIFGARGLDMLEFLKNGSEGINDLRREARELGFVFSNELVASAEENNDKLETMKKIVDAQWVKVWADLAPTVLKLSGAFADLVTALSDLITLSNDTVTLDSLNKELNETQLALDKIAGKGFDAAAGVKAFLGIGNSKEENEVLRQQLELRKKVLQAAIEAKNLKEEEKELEEEGGGGGGSTGGTKMSAAEKLIAAQRERTAAIEETTRALDEMFFAGTISADEYEAAMEKVQKTTEKTGETAKELAKDIEEDTKRVSELQEIANGAVDQIGDALAQAASDGTIDFENMFKSIIAGALRAQLQVALIGKASEGGISGGGGLLGGLVKAATPFAMSYFGGTASTYGTTRGSQQTTMLAAQDAGFRAGGGRVYAGRSYNVGELRAERFTPDTNGTIDPHPKNGGTAGNNVKVVVNNSGTPKNAQVAQKQIGKDVIINVILDDMEQNGKFSRHMGTTFGVTRKA